MKYSDLFRTAAAAALSLAVAAVPAVAKNGNTKVKPAVAKPASAGPKAKVQAPKAQAPKAAKAQAPKAKAQAPKAAGAATTRSSTKSASAKGSSSKADRSGDGTPAASLQDFAAPSQPLSKAQQKLLANENLRNKMRARLPRGTDPMVAASGFKNLGQFVAAVNVSNNLGIDFTMLKGLMVNRGMSLGQAIQQAKAIEARRATSLASAAVRQADDEISATSLASVSATKKTKDKS